MSVDGTVKKQNQFSQDLEELQTLLVRQLPSGRDSNKSTYCGNCIGRHYTLLRPRKARQQKARVDAHRICA
jgi:hypothetical protein